MSELDRAIEYYKTSNNRRIHLSDGSVINMLTLLLSLKEKLK